MIFRVGQVVVRKPENQDESYWRRFGGNNYQKFVVSRIDYGSDLSLIPVGRSTPLYGTYSSKKFTLLPVALEEYL